MVGNNIFENEAFAQRYAEKHQKMAEKFGKEYARKLKVRRFSEGKILDAGCGFGGTLLYLLKGFPEAEGVGIDASDVLLELARETAEAQGMANRVTFEKGDVQEMPYPDDSFDVVISTNVVHHVANPTAMLREIKRVLAPEGLLYIADIRQNWLVGLFDKAFRETLDYYEVRALIQRANYDDAHFTTGLLWWRYER
jgi:ubiquinone/menaquinone biosynthesis C-methylase UbiE